MMHAGAPDSRGQRQGAHPSGQAPSHQEKADRLAARIRAHRLFANYDIRDWIDEFLSSQAPRRRVLDIGCGAGNHLEVYDQYLEKGGSITGLDRDPVLLERAARAFSGSSRFSWELASMDEPLPFEDDSFDTVFSNFAIYNATDLARTLREARRVMTASGLIVLIGPTPANARALYEFNERLTGIGMDELIRTRTSRMKEVVAPELRRVFSEVREFVIRTELTFPDETEFLTYFTSTMLYESVAEVRGLSTAQMRSAVLPSDLVVSKEVLALVATGKTDDFSR